ncbi:MAG: mevalonate kinase [Proteobacteria bacterium]|nr:mevalonate kinase [Pseudomonadota bacterium]
MSRGHGKVILFGEHAVVHGRSALAAALDRGAVAHAEPATRCSLRVDPWGFEVELGVAPADPQLVDLERALRGLLGACRVPPQRGLCVRARVELPPAAGLGASAALAVAVVRAVGRALGQSRSAAEIIEVVRPWESVFHGNPSGVDSFLATHGGLVRFRKGQGGTVVRSNAPLHLVVGHSGQSGTKRMVDAVARRLERQPADTQAAFDEIASLAQAGEKALVAGDLTQLGSLMDSNQQALRRLGVSTPKLDTMCQAARQAGALGAKLTGGGGGGCMVALAESKRRAREIAAPLLRFSQAVLVTEVSA